MAENNLQQNITSKNNVIEHVHDASSPVINGRIPRNIDYGQDNANNNAELDPSIFSDDALLEESKNIIEGKTTAPVYNGDLTTEIKPRGVSSEALKTLSQQPDEKFHKNINPAGVSVEVSKMAAAANLNADDVLAIYTFMCGPGNINLLAAWVYMLYNGSASVGVTVSSMYNTNVNDQPITISGNMLTYMWTRGNSVIKKKFHKKIEKAFKKTPAYKSKFFEDVGDVGVTLVSNADRTPVNPMKNSIKHTPSLAEQMLNKIHPKFTQELEKYLDVLRGKLYLALPANILGSIQYCLNYINGIITAYAQMINEVFQGCLRAIQEFIAMIDGIMQPIMLWFLTLLDNIIPLDIICLILDILSLFVGDLTMFTNLFSQSVKISDFLKLFNLGETGDMISNFLSNPTSILKSFLPEEVSNILNLVDSVANDPLGYLGEVLGEYGHGYMMNYLKGDIMGGILNQFGSQAPILYPISGIMKKYGFSGKVQLTDPNQPSPNVVLPPGITNMRKNIKRTFDNFSNSLDATTANISNSIFETTGVDPNSRSTPLAGIKRVY